jgi:lipopolysaccharide/colanic/teichoic acid biosynthesis glycosyltransferase
MQELTEIATPQTSNKPQTSVIHQNDTDSNAMYLFIKRCFDMVCSAIALIVLAPILVPIMIGLRFTGEGYVFYFQKRIGYKKQYFNIWKFATMLKNSPNIGTGSITLRNDPRLIPMGKFLRMTKINELPQIINVLIGNMSIVGPRPLVDKTFGAYNDYVQANVYNSKPGITGIGSIVFRDEESLISESKMEPHQFYKDFVAPHKGELEMWYQKNKSTLTDLLIIFLTAWVIVFSKSNLVYKIFKDLPKRSF